MELKNTMEFVSRFNDIVSRCDWTDEEEELMSVWISTFALQLVKDLGVGLAGSVADVMSSVAKADGH